MLARYIKRVRRADPAVRTRHAFLWAVGVTGIAAALWAVTLPSALRPLPESATVADAPRPWSSFFAKAKEQLAAVGAAGEDGAAAEAETPSPTPGTLELSPEALAEARTRAAIDYVPPVQATTTATSTPSGVNSTTVSSSSTPGSKQPRVVRIATTTAATSTGTASTTR